MCLPCARVNAGRYNNILSAGSLSELGVMGAAPALAIKDGHWATTAPWRVLGSSGWWPNAYSDRQLGAGRFPARAQVSPSNRSVRRPLGPLSNIPASRSLSPQGPSLEPGSGSAGPGTLAGEGEGRRLLPSREMLPPPPLAPCLRWEGSHVHFTEPELIKGGS